MAPKNKKKNSFYFFMKEMQENEAAKGRRVAICDMPQIAHPIWAQMSVAEREPYEARARAFNSDPAFRGGKLASDGTSIEENLREELEKERRENAMKLAIKTYVNIDCISEEDFKAFASRKIFYFISFNILCHTEKEYIPNEVGIVEYSLQQGLIREYSTIIHPGKIPTGYTGEAKRLSEEKHGIDIFGEPSAERNLVAVYKCIKDFTNSDGTDEFPPLFSSEDDLVQNRGCLQWLSGRARERNYFEVWNTKYLLMELRAGAGHPLPSGIIAGDLLNKSSFNYHPEARCEFHDEKDIHFCALAYSKRICYLISDATCLLFDIQLTENHMPCRALEDKEYIVTISNESARRNKPFIPPLATRLDQRSNYYQNENGQFADVETVAPPVRPKNTSEGPRQPAASCIAAEMARLKLNMTTATVPGHGIGRGQRRNN